MFRPAGPCMLLLVCLCAGLLLACQGDSASPAPAQSTKSVTEFSAQAATPAPPDYGTSFKGGSCSDSGFN